MVRKADGQEARGHDSSQRDRSVFERGPVYAVCARAAHSAPERRREYAHLHTEGRAEEGERDTLDLLS